MRSFFKSVHATLSHLLWADRMWMSRLAGTSKPPGGISDSVKFCEDWEALRNSRVALDETILQWANDLDPASLERDLTWFSGAIQKDMIIGRWLAIAHFFN